MDINWTALLAAKGLEAPGYQETLADVRNNPWRDPKRKTTRTSKKQGRSFPSAKHGAD